jgi:hypothetical protein
LTIKPDQLVFQLHHQDSVFLVGNDFDLAKPFAQIHHRDDFPAEINYPFNRLLGVRHGGDFRDTDDFANRADAHPERFLADAKTHDLKFFFHQRVSGTSGANEFRIFNIARVSARVRRPEEKSRLAFACTAAIENEAIHAVQQVARKLQHLLRAADSSVELDADCCTSSRILSIAAPRPARRRPASRRRVDFLVISVSRPVALAICDEPTDCSLVAAPISCENL